MVAADAWGADATAAITAARPGTSSTVGHSWAGASSHGAWTTRPSLPTNTTPEVPSWIDSATDGSPSAAASSWPSGAANVGSSTATLGPVAVAKPDVLHSRTWGSRSVVGTTTSSLHLPPCTSCPNRTPSAADGVPQVQTPPPNPSARPSGDSRT